MGKAKRQKKSGVGFGKRAFSADLYPFKVFSEPSLNTPGLMRLCLGHVETDAVLILETYYPNEVDLARQKFCDWFAKHPRVFSLSDLEREDLAAYRKIDRGVPKSRSTDEFLLKSKGAINLNLVGYRGLL